MKRLRRVLGGVGVGAAIASSLFPQTIVLAPDRVMDGRGVTLVGARVVVEGDRIAAIGPTNESVPEEATVYDLTGLTLLPGLIDTHVHIDWHFDPDGRTHSGASEDTEAEQMLFAVENAYLTLMGGVTTAQSLGAAIHVRVSGRNTHHMVESCFKGLGRALRQAIHRSGNEIPSTKGIL